MKFQDAVEEFGLVASLFFGPSITLCFPYRGDITAIGVRKRMKENQVPFWSMSFKGILFSVCVPKTCEEKIREIFKDCDFFIKQA